MHPWIERVVCLVSCILAASPGYAQTTTVLTSQPAGAARAAATSGWDFEPRPLATIPAGTALGEGPPPGWSHLLLFVESRLASGDVEVVSKTVAHYCQLLKPVVLANVLRTDHGHVLEQVAIGFATQINGEYVVVSSDTYRELGANLGMIGSHVLASNERMLKEFTQVARSPVNMVIDTPVVMLHNDEHVTMTMRLAVWAAPEGGQLGSAVWLLQKNGNPGGEYAIVEDTFQFLPPGTREDRVLNVKKDRFTFGIPAADAFAMVRLPPGTPFRFTEELATHAARRQFDPDSYRAFWTALAAALGQSPVSAK